MAIGDPIGDQMMGPGGGGGPPPGGPPSGPPGAPPGPPAGGAPPGMAAFIQGQNQPQVSAPGPGNQADGMMNLQMIVSWLSKIAPSLEGTPAQAEIFRTLERLTRMISKQGGGAPLGVQQTQLGDMMRQTQQNALAQQIMGKIAGNQAAQPPNAPPPSTPFPGA